MGWGHISSIRNHRIGIVGLFHTSDAAVTDTSPNLNLRAPLALRSEFHRTFVVEH